ncbi:malectin domain-containing carbohydrate-binding protein [Hymenobacter wooponensis]|uniref:T9SS type A sorting domain-containing protein n=1 Tax=Hymenobacter wooponensis TaxID=1525360 RepID=A0A4Z0MB28_9BACT|nr:malectin domain-containing carbohydrate-binding protein [Hymenobacter wooponensis]TGD76684.1 T9SS type A sorting domain-containing protein [Hymenobacter wooponensis]
MKKASHTRRAPLVGALVSCVYLLGIPPGWSNSAISYAAPACATSFEEAGRLTPPSPTPLGLTSFWLAPAGDTVRINCGGGQVTTSGPDQKVFLADSYYTGGTSFANPAVGDVGQTTDDELYRSERSAGTDRGGFSYHIPVSLGTYKVRLHFAEIYFGAPGGAPGGRGQRLFSVNLEGRPVLVNYDISASGAPATAQIQEYTTAVLDGELTLDFSASVNQPTVAAIEVIRSTAVPASSCRWQPVAAVDYERKEGQSALVDGLLYTFGGYYGNLIGTNLTQRYEVATNTWINLAPAPLAVTHMGVAVAGKKVWLIGGFVGNHPGPVTSAVQVYDTQTNSWSLGPPLPAPRGSGAAAVVGHHLHAFGGLLPDRRTDTGDHYVLDLNNIAAGWHTAAPLPEPRNHLGGATVGGKIYAIGGQNDHDGTRSIRAFLHVYDPATNAWTRLANLPSNRSHFEPGTIALDGKILIVGGSDNFSDYGDILSYDPATNIWSKFCDLPTTLVAPFAQVIGSNLVVAQGARDNNAIPEKATYLTPITRQPSNVLRFSSPQLAVELPQGGTKGVLNLLWSHSGTAAYSLTVVNSPAWLHLPASTGVANPLGQEVPMQLDATGLAPGIYSAVVQAKAPGYAVATTTVQLTVTGNGVVFAVNAGGEAYTDANHISFQSDRNFRGGSTYQTSSPIAGTTDDVLYQTERYGNFSYAITLPNGTYRLTFKLAEIYWTAPRVRQFDVLVEGQELLSNLDIYAEAKADLTALDLVRTVRVTDGELNLEFRTDADNAKLAALVVQSVAAPGLASLPSARPEKTWSLFPNPVIDQATLSYTATSPQAARAELLNSQGYRVWQGTQRTAVGGNKLTFPTEKLSPGPYMLRVYLQEGVISERVLVTK